MLLIKPHPRLSIEDKDRRLDIELKEFDLKGRVDKPLIREFYNLFSWIYIDGSFDYNKIENVRVREILSKYDLFYYKGVSISYSAILFYTHLSFKYNMQALSQGRIVKQDEESNRLFSKDYFLFDDLYKMYAGSDSDLSTDFLLFNSIFRAEDKKKVEPIKSPGDVVKSISKVDLVRPDFSYKLATKQLKVNYNEENKNNDGKVIYVLQDCTNSMKRYKKQINMVKAFILNEAFKNDFIVNWLFVESKEVDFQQLSKETIKQTKLKDVIYGTTVNVTKLLTEDRFLGKQVIIITDGTDSFDFKFNTKTKKIHVISFRENDKIKNKIANYGRFFRTRS